MLRKTKREELQYKKRGIGGERSPPHYVVSDHLLYLPSNYIKFLVRLTLRPFIGLGGMATQHLTVTLLKLFILHFSNEV